MHELKSMMKIIDRVKGILFSPKTEWEKIEKEPSTLSGLFTGYVLILLIIPVAASFLGLGLVGYRMFLFHVVGFDLGLKFAIIVAASIIATYFAGAFMIDAMATSFKSEKNINHAAKLSAYATTAICVAGIFFLIPSLYILGMLGALYGVYIIYTGIEKTMKVPADQVVPYMLVAGLVMAVVYCLSMEILSHLIIKVGVGSLRFG